MARRSARGLPGVSAKGSGALEVFISAGAAAPVGLPFDGGGKEAGSGAREGSVPVP